MKFGAVETVDGIEFSLPEVPDVTKEVLAQLKTPETANVYIGCPVWGDRGYVGTMYPKGTKQKDYLQEYCKQFNSIEVNATRYGIPAMTTLENWKSRAGEDFIFSFKMPQVITHRKDMNDAEARARLDKFLEAIDFFGEKAGMTFMLMPNYMKTDRYDSLAKFLGDLPKDFSSALELRNPDFYQRDDFYAMLREYQIPLVVTDSPGRRDVMHQILTSDTLFVRFVGNKLHPTDYTRIDQWVIRISEWLNDGLKNVYFFMHQPAPFKYLSGNLSAYMIKKLKELHPELAIKEPIDYSLEDPTLF